MPLSDHEQRILADIEARLRADDPGLADAVSTRTVAAHLRRRLRWVALGLLAGFVLLFVGLTQNLLWGVLGFVIMLAAVYYGLTLAKQIAQATGSGPPGQGRNPLQRYLGGAPRDDNH
jgi:hypothetical protein